jgi:hypothetical protein
MRNGIASLFSAILLVCFALPGCSYMTAQGRREMVYRHYVNKHIKQRQHQIARAKAQANRKMKNDLKSPGPSEPIVNAGAQSSEPVAAPVMISPSPTAESDNPPAEP